MVEVFCQHGLVRDPRSVFQRCNPLGTNGMYRAAEFLDAVSKPQAVFLGNPIVLRLCRAAHYAEWARERPAFQQLCADRLGIVFSIRSGSIASHRPPRGLAPGRDAGAKTVKRNE